MADPTLEEIARRRTFAIISHPDAGKTTLTEKVLLYGGAIQVAGEVKARKNKKSATSDWMAMEKERGISVATSVMQIDFEGHRINLLDTPGHNDFSEDTYRTLAAADCAVMLVDHAKGVEPQTIKLFDVCRMRGIPIVTFVNKLDRPGLAPLDILDEIENVLQIPTCPMTWPIGTAKTKISSVSINRKFKAKKPRPIISPWTVTDWKKSWAKRRPKSSGNLWSC